MDPVEDRDFIWYLDGCKRLGWTPLEADAFCPQFQRYQSSHRFLQAWETYRAHHTGVLVLVQSLVLSVSVRRMRRERDQLGHLGSAVAASRYGDNGDSQSGRTFVPSPPPPDSGWAQAVAL